MNAMASVSINCYASKTKQIPSNLCIFLSNLFNNNNNKLQLNNNTVLKLISRIPR